MAKQDKVKDFTSTLEQIIDIAIEALIEYPPAQLDEASFHDVLKWYKDQKTRILQMEPKFRTMGNLKNKQKEVLTFFQESTGKTVTFFWQLIKEKDLPIQRENIIEKVLKRNKISNQFEYDSIIDTIVLSEQEGLITKEQRDLLASMLGQFETKRKKSY